MFDIQNNETYLHAGYLHAGRQHVHAHHVLGPDAGALHDQLLVAELHPVEPRNRLVRDRHVDVLAERVTLSTGIQLGVQSAVDSLNWSPVDGNAIWCTARG